MLRSFQLTPPRGRGTLLSSGGGSTMNQSAVADLFNVSRSAVSQMNGRMDLDEQLTLRTIRSILDEPHYNDEDELANSFDKNVENLKKRAENIENVRSEERKKGRKPQKFGILNKIVDTLNEIVDFLVNGTKNLRKLTLTKIRSAIYRESGLSKLFKRTKVEEKVAKITPILVKKPSKKIEKSFSKVEEPSSKVEELTERIFKTIKEPIRAEEPDKIEELTQKICKTVEEPVFEREEPEKSLAYDDYVSKYYDGESDIDPVTDPKRYKNSSVDSDGRRFLTLTVLNRYGSKEESRFIKYRGYEYYIDENGDPTCFLETPIGVIPVRAFD